ncbi:hypothetical protein DC522_10670 [Microvirga sp. KLBC 81]|nr:hypothetical protein DC522_10670 [Microvirga sp. KLBC 81]
MSDTRARIKAVEEAPCGFLCHDMPIALDILLDALVSLCGGEDGIPAGALDRFLQQRARFRFHLIWSDARHSSHALTWCPVKKRPLFPAAQS